MSDVHIPRNGGTPLPPSDGCADRFHAILCRRPAKQRRNLSPADIETLKQVDLDAIGWSPSKAMSALELMQIALRHNEQGHGLLPAKGEHE